jgi:chemotaxis protein histidine kinase CheA
MKASKKEFVAETEEILFDCRQLVLEIQDTYQTAVNPDTINAFFRAIHTLKGLSGLFGNQSITDVSHSLESLLDEVRLGKVTISGEVVDFLFRSIDTLVSALEAVKEDRDTDLDSFIQEIKTFRASLQHPRNLRKSPTPFLRLAWSPSRPSHAPLPSIPGAISFKTSRPYARSPP